MPRANVKTVDKRGITRDSGKRVVVADTQQRIARRTHEPTRSKVCTANLDMPNIYESKRKVVRVLY